MSDSDFIRDSIRELKTGVAVAEPESWAVLFENAKFFQWFPPQGDPDASVEARLEDMNAERARGRLERGRPYSFETEVKDGAKTVSLSVELRKVSLDDREVILIECQDLTKQKQTEYMLDSYSKLAEKNARELERERDRVEKLLLNIMPKSVYEEMKDFGTATPERFESASVLMLDFVDFTEMAIASDPAALIGELNDIFSAFDRIAELFGCERIKTMGDAYMAVSGLPEKTVDHAINIAKVALRMRRYVEKRNASHPTQWQCRIGITTGPVIGSLVGIQKYVYDIFGPAVNLAARLEAHSAPMEITVSENTHTLIKDQFSLAALGEVDLKGFEGENLYRLDYERAQ